MEDERGRTDATGKGVMPDIAPVSSDDFIDSILDRVSGPAFSPFAEPADDTSVIDVSDDSAGHGADNDGSADGGGGRVVVDDYDESLVSEGDWVTADDIGLIDKDLASVGRSPVVSSEDADAAVITPPNERVGAAMPDDKSASAFATALSAEPSVSPAEEPTDLLAQGLVGEPIWADDDAAVTERAISTSAASSAPTTPTASAAPVDTDTAAAKDTPQYFTPHEIEARKNKDEPVSSLGDLFASEPRFVIGAAVLIAIGLACIVVGIFLLR